MRNKEIDNEEGRKGEMKINSVNKEEKQKNEMKNNIENMNKEKEEKNDYKDENLKLLRLTDVLKIVPISKACWWRGIKNGRYPKGYKIGVRITVWKKSDIDDFVNNPEQFSK